MKNRRLLLSFLVYFFANAHAQHDFETQNDVTSNQSQQMYPFDFNRQFQKVPKKIERSLREIFQENIVLFDFDQDYTHLGPQIFGALDLVNLNTDHLIGKVFQNRTSKFCLDHLGKSGRSCYTNDANFWLEPVVYYMTQDEMQSQIGFKTLADGIIIGTDAVIDDKIVVGIGGGWVRSNTDWYNSKGKAKVDGGYLGVYTNASEDTFFIEASILASLNLCDAHRTVFIHSVHPMVQNIYSNARHENHSYTFDIHLGAGGNIEVGDRYFFEPFAKFDYFGMYSNEFKESYSGIFDLIVQKRFSGMLRSEVGLSFSKSFDFGKCGCFAPTIMLSAVNELFAPSSVFTSRFVGQSDSFNMKSFSKPIYLASPGLDISLVFDNTSSLNIQYSAELNREIVTQKFDARVNFSF